MQKNVGCPALISTQVADLFLCDSCKTVESPNKDPKVKSMKGYFQMFCCSICVDDAENYKVDFAGVDNLQSRALLMALAVFTYMRYFNNQGKKEGREFTIVIAHHSFLNH